MTFRATIREIDNGFLVEHPGSKMFEYSEIHVQTFDTAIALLIAKYAEEHPSVTVPVMPTKNPSEAAVKYTKICGLISKPLGDFQEQFFKSFPGEDPGLAVLAAHCKVVEGIESKVVFVGG